MTQASSWIDLEEGTRFSGYHPGPDATGPALVVLQEIYGVNEEVRRVVDFYAAHGFRAMAPDLLWRVEPRATFDYSARDAARDAIARLTTADIVGDIVKAAQVLRHRSGGSARVGVLSLGWSGQYALSAAQGTTFDAVATYYPGNLAQHVPTAQGVRAPLQFHFSARDTRTPLELRTAFRRGLADRDDVEIHTYTDGDPDHGFANQGRPEYHPTAAGLADARTLDFFARTLKR